MTLPLCGEARANILTLNMKLRENARSLSTMLCHITTLVENMIDAQNPWVGPSKRKSVIGSFLGPRSKDGAVYRFTDALPNWVRHHGYYPRSGVYTRRLLISQ